MDSIGIIKEILTLPRETEWVELKTGFSDPQKIGEYISAISNSAAMYGKKYGYMVWGISDDIHEIVGTNFDYNGNAKNKSEPLLHYLARSLTPSIDFSFSELYVSNTRLVLLSIPASKIVPTEFNRERFIRIGSSKENLRKYPQREAALWNVLTRGLPSLTNTDSERQELTFEKLILYYSAKNKNINIDTYKNNLHLINEETGKYNLLALLLSDDNAISVRVSIFNGDRKSQGLRSVKEFGNTCILYALDAVANYGRDVLNIPLTSEVGRVLERKDVYLFDNDSFREAIINAFVHNNWQYLNAPQISVFTDRIEILSHGLLSQDQTFEGFYKGESKPVNPALAHVFMQLGISDRSGKGVPTIIDRYGKDVFSFGEDAITVTIPFSKYTSMKLNDDDKILSKIKNNPEITMKELSEELDISYPMIMKRVYNLKEKGCLLRAGSKKNGSWKVTY